MKNNATIAIITCFCLLSSIIHAAGPSVAALPSTRNPAADAMITRINPWSVTPQLTQSTTLKGTLSETNIKEIVSIEEEILLITKHIKDIQAVLGDNFNGPGSTSPLTPRELRTLRNNYQIMINNYWNIVRWFGTTDHYYMPLAPEEYKALLDSINHFAKKAGLGTLEKTTGQPLLVTTGNTAGG